MELVGIFSCFNEGQLPRQLYSIQGREDGVCVSGGGGGGVV